MPEIPWCSQREVRNVNILLFRNWDDSCGEVDDHQLFPSQVKHAGHNQPAMIRSKFRSWCPAQVAYEALNKRGFTALSEHPFPNIQGP